MIGYGPESSNFVIELTYNYGVTSYELGNDFDGITIKSNDIIIRAKENNYPITNADNTHIIHAPDGYKFYILNEAQSADTDPIVKVGICSTNLENSINYWNNTLQMKLLDKSDSNAILAYSDNQAKLELVKLNEPSLNRGKAYGRIAFAIPYDQQPTVDAAIKSINGVILTPLISLDTPDKATVRVIILADPDGHEICFVDEEGFTKLSEVDPEGNKLLEKYIKKDPFQPK